MAPPLENKLIIYSHVVWQLEGGHVHNSTSWKELLFLLNMRLVCRTTAGAFSKSRGKWLKRTFQRNLEYSKYSFLLNWELPHHRFCVLLICIDTYWVFLGVWIQGLLRQFAVLCAVQKFPGRQELVDQVTPKAVIRLNHLHFHSGHAVSAKLLTQRCFDLGGFDSSIQALETSLS